MSEIKAAVAKGLTNNPQARKGYVGGRFIKKFFTNPRLCVNNQIQQTYV